MTTDPKALLRQAALLLRSQRGKKTPSDNTRAKPVGGEVQRDRGQRFLPIEDPAVLAQEEADNRYDRAQDDLEMSATNDVNPSRMREAMAIVAKRRPLRMGR